MRMNSRDKSVNGDVPGNAMASQAAFDRGVHRLGLSWMHTTRQVVGLREDGLVIHRVTLKGVWGYNEELLVVLAADGPDGPVVAFHGVDDIQSLWTGLSNRIRNGKMKWRPDEYAR